MVNSLGSLVIDIKSDTTQLIQGFNRAEAAVNKTTKQMSYAVKGLIGAFVGLNTLDIAKNFTKQLDLITSANNKLKLVTKTTEEYTNAQKRLFEVAQITSQGYGETVSLYSKLSDSMGRMGKSQEEIFRVVETVNKGIALSGSTAQESAAAILQFGQAVGKGILGGDELGSLSENAQGLLKIIADGMGLAVGDLKDLGSQGKITSDLLVSSILKMSDATDSNFSKMNKTISQSSQNISNAIQKIVGDFDKMTGISNVIADNIQGISKALEAINSDDLESMFNTFKLGTELILASYVALKLLRGGQEAYNFVSNATAEISKRNIDIEIAKNKAYNDGITAAYARKTADEAMAKAQENTANISQRNIEIEKAKAQAYSDGTRAVMARKLADEAMANAQSSNLVMLEKHAKELDTEATQLEKVAKKQLDYSYAIEAKAVKPADMKYAKQLESEAIQLEKTAKKQLEHSYALEATAKRFNIATIATNAFKMAMSTIPFIAITTGLGLIIEKIMTASKESTLFKESLTKTTDELKKLSQAQVEVRIIGGVEELKKAEEQLAKLKKDLEKVPSNISIGGNVGGIGTIDVEKTNKKLSEQRSIIQANIDTVQFQVDKNKELLGILNDIKGEKTTTVKINTLIPKTETNLIDWLINGDEVINKKVSIEVQKQGLTDELKNILEPKQVIIDKYKKLNEDLAKTDKNTTEYQLKLQKQMNDEIDNLDKEAVEKRKKAQSDKEKAIKDSEDRIKNLTKDATDLTISDVDKINAKYLEMYNVIKDTFSQEQMKAFNTSWQEAVEKANGTLDAQKAKQDLVNQALATATNEVDTINNKYMEMYEAIKDNPLFDEAKMTEFYKKWQDEIDKTKEKLDFNTTIELDIIGDDKSIQRIEKSFQDLNKATKHYEENRAKIKKGSEKEAQNEEMFRKDQMNGYINMAGALGSMFEQGSKEAATFQAAQQSLALVEGTRAILTSGTGDPYTAIPRMAAMGIMVKSLLGNIGVALGMTKVSESTSSDSMSSLKANTGMGTVLGDSTRQSESIAKAMGILEDFAEPQFEVLESMNSYLETIANSIGGVSRLLIQSGQYGKAFGAGFTPTSTDTGWKGMGVTTNNLGSKIIGSTEKLFTSVLGDSLGGTTGKLFTLPTAIANKALSSAINGIFGKTSTTTSTKLTDSGIYFADQLLSNARDEIYGSMYQTVQKKTTTTKKSWFGSSTSTKKKKSTSMYDMDGNTELERQFSLILDSMYNSTFEASKALDFTAEEITNTLDNFVVSIGKVSLKGLNGDQIQERLTSIFGAIGDDLAKTAFPLLVDFQQVGEGMYTTMTRVATGMEEARFYTDRLGTATVKYTDIINQQGVVGFEALVQSIIKADEATYGLNNGVVQMIGNMSATTEELYNTYLTFGNIRDILQATNQSASNLSSSMILGAGSISALEAGTESYMENFLSDSERIKVEMNRLSDEFAIAGYSLPQTREAFVDLIKSIDTSTENGAKAYGRLISLSGVFNDTISDVEDNLANIKTLSDRLAQTGMTDEQKLAFQRQQELATATDETSKSLLKQIYAQEDYNTKVAETKTILEKLLGTFTNLGDSVSDTIKTLAGANTDSMSATQQIKSFWEKRKEIDSLLALNGNLTESQQSRLSDLVGEVNDLATNIQGLDTSSSSITNELIGDLTSLESALNFKEQVLSVNIVGIASNVALIENIAGISATVPTLTNNTSNYVTNSDLSTDIKDILTTIKDNIYNYPRKTFEILDNVVNGNQKVKVQS